jgi:hypothetical protein
MTPKPLIAAATLLAVAFAFLPAPADSTVPRTVLVEETGWTS